MATSSKRVEVFVRTRPTPSFAQKAFDFKNKVIITVFFEVFIIYCSLDSDHSFATPSRGWSYKQHIRRCIYFLMS